MWSGWAVRVLLSVYIRCYDGSNVDRHRRGTGGMHGRCSTMGTTSCGGSATVCLRRHTGRRPAAPTVCGQQIPDGEVRPRRAGEAAVTQRVCSRSEPLASGVWPCCDVCAQGRWGPSFSDVTSQTYQTASLHRICNTALQSYTACPPQPGLGSLETRVHCLWRNQQRSTPRPPARHADHCPRPAGEAAAAGRGRQKCQPAHVHAYACPWDCSSLISD